MFSSGITGQINGAAHDLKTCTLMLFILAATTGACKGKNHKTDADASADVLDSADQPSEIADSWDVDTTDVDASDSDCFSLLEAVFEPSLDSLSVLSADRSPTPCEGCCRQVTLANITLETGDTPIITDVDVWNRFLVYRQSGFATVPPPFEIRLVDLQEGAEYLVDRAVPSAPDMRMNYSPAIHQHRLVYSKAVLNTSIDYELVLLSLQTGESEVILTGEVPSSGWGPQQIDIFDDYIVWQENRVGAPTAQELYLMHIPTRDVSVISTGGCCVNTPQIWGHRVVYSDFSSGDKNIVVYDISSGETSRITDDSFDQWHPKIWQDIVVWVDARNGGSEESLSNSDIYLHNLTSGETIQITTNTYTQMSGIDVFQDTVVWRDLRDDPEFPSDWTRATNINIYMYSIASESEHRITDYSGIEDYPLVFGNRHFFTMLDSSDITSVFMKQQE